MNQKEVLEFIDRYVIERYGSRSLFAKENGMSATYVCDILNGRKDPSAKILSAVGLVKVVSYHPVEVK